MKIPNLFKNILSITGYSFTYNNCVIFLKELGRKNYRGRVNYRATTLSSVVGKLLDGNI